MSWVHDILYASAGVVSSPFWGYRLWRTGKWRTDWAARFGKTTKLPSFDGKTVLLHGVSVGEINAIRQLVDKLHIAGQGKIRLVISTTTDTGLYRARQIFGAQHTVVRYPFDFTFSVERFLDAVRPDLVALVELEVWPNFIGHCAKRAIPVAVVNGRLSSRSIKGYRTLRPLLRSTFARLAAVGAQTSLYADRFVQMGTDPARVHIFDSMKWDTAQIMDAQAVPGAADLAAAMGIDRTRPLIVAGSTTPGEDKLLIDTCPPEAQLLLVPRKPEWFARTARLVPGIVRRTRHPDGTLRALDGQRLFLMDTMGELRKAYALADVCLVGRSFLGLYGSDMMEPAALGKPTIVGPFHHDFKDMVEALCSGHGLMITNRPGQAAGDLLRDRAQAQVLGENARRVVRARQGSTEKHVRMLLDLLGKGGS